MILNHCLGPLRKGLALAIPKTLQLEAVRSLQSSQGSSVFFLAAVSLQDCSRAPRTWSGLYHKKVNFEVRNLFLPRSASALTDGIRTIVRLSSAQKLSFLEKYFFSLHIDYFYYGKIRNYTHAQKKDF